MASRYDDVLRTIWEGRAVTREMVVGVDNPTDQPLVAPSDEPLVVPSDEPPYTTPERLEDDDEQEQATDDADYEAFLAELFGTSADSVTDEVTDAPYVPFQDVPDDWGRGLQGDEPGYAESVAPYLF